MTNVDTRLATLMERALRVEQERRDRAEDLKQLFIEAKGTGFSKEEIKGVKLAVRQSFETADKKAERISAQELADSLGVMVGTPLADAAVARARVQ